ncbi:MAG: 50S ribosomal protein L11 methyltransferase [Desulfobacteraceae bacterium]
MAKPEHPAWLEISVDVHPVAHEALSAFLFNLGCNGIVTEEFRNRTLKAYLPVKKEFEDIQNRIKLFLRELEKIFLEVKSPKLTISQINDQDWSLIWRNFFRPQRITGKLTILPPWEPIPPCLEGHVITIDPGPAFGTGQHPTTRMCLEAIEKCSPAGSWTMLDVGTGSGILAIYGAKLEATRILALDTDPVALRWAERNIALNDLSGAIELSSVTLENWAEGFSLVTANLILDTILELFPHFARVLDHGGQIILSGLLREQVHEVEKELARYGLGKDRVSYQEDWACLIAEKSGRGWLEQVKMFMKRFTRSV